jgi:tetratricopeptide (TPR) repeat protein
MSSLLGRFEANLRSTVRQCREAGVPVVLGTAPANLKVDPDIPVDWLVGSSRHAPGLPRDRLEAWNAAWRGGLERRAAGDLAGALARFRTAASIDPGYARGYREIGICLEGLGRFPEAREAYWRHIDLTRRLVTREVNAATRRVCRDLGVPCVDCAAAFEAAAPHGLPGYDLFVDSMHPNARGHEVLARAFHAAVDRVLSGRSSRPRVPAR